MRILFDIDGTICKTKMRFYEKSKPIIRMRKIINKLYDDGHDINFFTSRYMGRTNNNIKIIKKKYYLRTFNQLIKWGFKFNKLIMGKPQYDIFIDDRSYNTKDKNWLKKIK